MSLDVTGNLEIYNLLLGFGVSTQGLTLARQVLYYLSHSASL
jgi:hypothetical protein